MSWRRACRCCLLPPPLLPTLAAAGALLQPATFATVYFSCIWRLVFDALLFLLLYNFFFSLYFLH
jgi:hypothetical protein